jgi:hypothetical protein
MAPPVTPQAMVTPSSMSTSTIIWAPVLSFAFAIFISLKVHGLGGRERPKFYNNSGLFRGNSVPTTLLGLNKTL